MLITFDAETFYEPGYSVRVMSTSEYIRDPRFELLFAGIKVGKRKTDVVDGKDLPKYLAKIDWSTAELLAHHTHFDGLILSHHYKVLPRLYRDTLSMSRGLWGVSSKNDLDTAASRYGLGNKLPDILDKLKGKRRKDIDAALYKQGSAYVKQDVELCYELYHRMLSEFPAEELELVDLTCRMFCAPVLELDRPRAQKALEAAIEEKATLVKATGLPEKTITSREGFAQELKKLKVNPPMKPSPSNPAKLTYAFAKDDVGLKALLTHPKKRVRDLVAARTALSSSIGESRAARLLKSSENGMKLPVYLNYCGAHTTRWSGGDKMNYQNLPTDRDGGSAELRRSILAPKGHVLVVVDLSQIEPKLNAWYADHHEKLEDFRRKVDMYCKFATKAYGRTITKKDENERQVGKQCELGLGYRMGAEKLQATILKKAKIFVELEVCVFLVRLWRSENKPIVDNWERLATVIIDMYLGREGSDKAISWGKDHILLPNGLKLHYPGLKASIIQSKPNGFFSKNAPVKERLADAYYQSREGTTSIYDGLLDENIIQALARCAAADYLRVIAKKYRVVMFSHDEIVYLAKTKEAEAALHFGLDVCSKPPHWAPDLPVGAEGKYAREYSK